MRTVPTLFAAVTLAVTAHPAVAAPLTPADLQQSVAPLVENKTLQAVSLGLIQSGKVVTAHAGSLSPATTTPPDDQTLYEIGSITKVFTGLLLADAVVRGEVTLDTTLASLLPTDVTLPDGDGERITLRMLATHTSGLPRIPPEIPSDDYRDPYATYGEPELWATLRRVKLDFPPGTKASYSNLAVGLLGTLLARNAGMTYPELLAKRIAQPLGMKDTVIGLRDDLRDRFPPAFTSTGAPCQPWEFKALAAAGGIRSTTADMIRFANAVLHPETTSLQKAIELAWSKQTLAASITGGGQALGWMLAGDGRTRWHNGMTGGFHAALFVNRELGLATLVLSNRSTPAGSQIAEALMRRAAGVPERPAPNRDRATVALSAEQLDRCTGTFRVSPQFALVFERRNEALFLTPTGQATDRLYAASPETFFSRRVAADIVFEFPADGGPATALTLKQSGRQVRALRE
ncbi:beta-lactamase [Opitutus terrae PB90-1]|uniref:Beta-lactamase n=2 Tax=Opitutus terrae TaxID=107709 RepID=B1ZPT2_OPITP|nr:beta-lactamase [Opitutus terrae PB90-1]